MKKIFLFLSLLFLAIACEKQPIIEDKGKFEPGKMITIKAAPAKGYVGGLTPIEIVEQARAIRFRTHYIDNAYSERHYTAIRGFADNQKDFEIPALLMLGMDILNPALLEMYPDSDFGLFLYDWIRGWDVYVVDEQLDTIAYIPDEVLRTAEPLIWQAYVDSNYNEVYRLFDEAFTFLPIEQK